MLSELAKIAVLSGAAAVGDVIVALEYQVLAEGRTGLGKCAPATGQAIAAGMRCGVHHARDAAMPLVEQVLGCQVSAELAVESNLVARRVLNRAVDHHHGHDTGLELLHEQGVGRDLLGGDEEDAVGAAVDQQANQVGVVLGLAVGVHDEQGVSALAAAHLEVAGKRGEEAAHDVRHDKAEGPRLLHHKAARDLIGHIALLRGDFLDAPTILIRDAAGTVVENERHRRR